MLAATAQTYRVSKPPIDGIVTVKKASAFHGCGFASNGVDIQSDSSIAYNILGGEVTGCIEIEGKYIVMVRSGSLFYVYRNFKNIFVNKHQLINAYTPIGELEYDEGDKKYVLSFSIWDRKPNKHQQLPGWLVLKLLKAQKIAD